jgi:hypothetical protein
MTRIRKWLPKLALVATSVMALSATATAAEKPNILVIFGDDIGQTNISAYSMGVVGYKTPNIDRIAKEGMMFTDYYAENSCTAGRSSFITGQTPLRTGLSKVGLPGATVGLQKRDITIAQALKSQGYATGQFGKNHLGDRDEYLPTNHGFDEFFGNLYHLNAEEEPERPYWPKDDPEFVKANTPRGVIHSFADGKIEDTGALTTKRMETIDDETTAAAQAFIEKQAKADKPFFVWMNTTRMHLFTHVRDSMKGQSGMPGNEYADGMLEHDGDVGKLLKPRRPENRRQHHRGLHHRQRPEPVLLAGRGDHAVPQREELQLGRRLPRTGDGPLARQDQTGEVSNEMFSGWTGSRRCSRLPANRCERQTAQGLGADFRWHQLQGASGRLQPVALPDRPAAQERAPRVLLLQRRRRAGVNALTTTGKRCSANSAAWWFPVWSEPFVPAGAENLQPAHGPV